MIAVEYSVLAVSLRRAAICGVPLYRWISLMCIHYALRTMTNNMRRLDTCQLAASSTDKDLTIHGTSGGYGMMKGEQAGLKLNLCAILDEMLSRNPLVTMETMQCLSFPLRTIENFR